MGNEELPVIQYIRDDAKVFSVPYYEVGDFFETTNPTNPSERWKYGTWELYGKGKMTICIDTNDTDFNSAGKTGGEKEHTLTTDEMPSHSHRQQYTNPYDNTWVGGVRVGTGGTTSGAVASTGSWSNKGNAVAGTALSGSSQPHNNIPPYIVVYRWIRTA